jgi:hypothetical protein
MNKSTRVHPGFLVGSMLLICLVFCVVLLLCLLRFRMWTMLGSSLFPVVCRKAHVLFVCGGVRAVLCYCFVCFRLVCLCFQFFWIVNFWLNLLYYLTFIFKCLFYLETCFGIFCNKKYKVNRYWKKTCWTYI